MIDYKKIISIILIITGLGLIIFGFIYLKSSEKNDTNNTNSSSNNNDDKINKIKLKCDALLDAKEIDIDTKKIYTTLLQILMMDTFYH